LICPSQEAHPYFHFISSSTLANSIKKGPLSSNILNGKNAMDEKAAVI